jgi:hypothetical protein
MSKNNRYFTAHANFDLRDKLQREMSYKPPVTRTKQTRATRKAARLQRVVIAQGG